MEFEEAFLELVEIDTKDILTVSEGTDLDDGDNWNDLLDLDNL